MLYCVKRSRFFKKITPLQERFPDRFSIQNAIFGELTAPSEVVSLFNRVTRFISDIADLILSIKPAFAFRSADTITMVVAAHVIDRFINRYCEDIIGRAEAKTTRSKSKKSNATFRLKQIISTMNYQDVIADMKNEIYKSKSITVNVFSQRSKTYEGDCRASIRWCDFRSDTVFLTFDLKINENQNLKYWCEANTYYEDTLSSPPNVERGTKFTTPEDPGVELTIESERETVFAPVSDRVAILRNIWVLRGGQAKEGTSGSPVLDSHGRAVAMIIGRTSDKGEYKYLAASLARALAFWAEKEGEKTGDRPRLQDKSTTHQ